MQTSFACTLTEILGGLPELLNVKQRMVELSLI